MIRPRAMANDRLRRASGAGAGRAFPRGDSGSVVVEIALVFPVFVAILIGGFEGWRAFDQTSRLTAAANAGAQYAAQSGQTGASVNSKVTAAYAGDATNLTVSVSTISQCVNGTAPTGTTCSDGLTPIKYVDVAASDVFKPFFQFAPIPQTTLTRHAVAAYQ